MPAIPAYCDACGLVFNSGIVMENSYGNTFTNCGVNCPRCKSVARVPDGIYSNVGRTIEILSSSKRSARELHQLIDALKRAQNNNASREEVKAVINKHAPELKDITDTLPQNRSELYAAIQAICAVISACAAVAAIYLATQGITREQVEELINKAMTGDVKTSKPVRPRPVQRDSSSPRVGKKRLSRAKRKAANARSRQRAKN